jgi:small subunit ribosomal protein S16
MLKIRLKRTGRKKKPFYKIVLMENLSRRDGKAIAEIGFYDPITKNVQFNKTLLYKYINVGAYPTDTVRHLIFKSLSQIEQKKINSIS